MNDFLEWDRIFYNDLPENFILEVIFRSTVMFLILLLTLKLAGKRGVKQLSIFETVIIIALGSAAGDPMFYEDVGILPAAVVCMVIIILYRLVTWLTGISKVFEQFIEGKTECIIKEGKFSVTTFEKESLAQDEFFSELRIKSVEHLGQVKNAFLETSGDVSVFFYADHEVMYGLPILPSLFHKKSKAIPADGVYSCAFCGHTTNQKTGTAVCDICSKEEWVESIKTLRIS